jgi:hypothetical protein
MNKLALFLLFVTLIILVSCSKKSESLDNNIIILEGSALEEARERQKEIFERSSSESYKISLKDKIDGYSEEVFDGHEIFLSKRIDEYFDMYFYFYGKTREEIIEKCGSNYEVEELKISGYDYKYDRKEKMVYPSMYFTIYRDDDGESRLLSYEVWQHGEENYGNIIIGCDLDVIIKQLGKPNSFSLERYKDEYYISYSVAGYFHMDFWLDINYKLIRISMHEDLI